MIARLEALTRSEMAALTDEQVLHYIDVEIAVARIVPIMPPEGVEPIKPVLEKTETAFEFAGLLFKNRADANVVAEMELLSEEYDYKAAGYDYKWLKVQADRTITAKQYPTEETIRKMAAELAAYRAADTEWAAMKKAYGDFQDESSECRNRVYESVADAKEWTRSVTAAEDIYEKYLLLSGGDKQTARRLFHDAYSTLGDGVYAAVAASKGFVDWVPPETEEDGENDA